MKAVPILIAILAFAAPAFAQTISDESESYREQAKRFNDRINSIKRGGASSSEKSSPITKCRHELGKRVCVTTENGKVVSETVCYSNSQGKVCDTRKP